jgi:hypothetical protein
VLATIDASAPPRLRQVCGAPLVALDALGDGTAIAVGGGAYTFRVWPTLEATLEATQTQRDLFGLAIGADGQMWSGGAAGRVLRRETAGWARVGIDGVSSRVLAVRAATGRVRVFCEDGMVVEGGPS